MTLLPSLLAGLGLFIIGTRLIGSHLKAMASRRMRQWIARAVGGRGSVAVFGLAAGAVMQSLNAVTFVLVALVTAGSLDKRRAWPIIRWANVGTAALVLVASLDLHLLALLLVGATGVAYYAGLDQSARYRHLVGAWLGLGLLFVGIDEIKQVAALLRGSAEVREALLLTAQRPWLGFVIGIGIAWIAQSSTTVTVVAMALASAGLLDVRGGALIVAGAGLGAPLSALTLAGRLRGSARQLVVYQIVLRAFGVAGVLLLFGLLALQPGVLEGHGPALGSASPPVQLAAVALAMPLLSIAAMIPLHGPVTAWLERRLPPTHEEALERPHFLQDEALDEPETALLLLDREQQRLLHGLPGYLARLVPEAARPDGPPVAVRGSAERRVLELTDRFAADLLDRHHSRDVLDRVMTLRDRNEILAALQESLVELDRIADRLPAGGAAATPLAPLVDSLHLMLEALADTGSGDRADADDLETLRLLTHDRSDMMDALRRRLQADGLSPDLQKASFQASTLFERCVWLLRRYVLLLRSGDGAAASPQH